MLCKCAHQIRTIQHLHYRESLACYKLEGDNIRQCELKFYVSSHRFMKQTEEFQRKYWVLKNILVYKSFHHCKIIKKYYYIYSPRFLCSFRRCNFPAFCHSDSARAFLGGILCRSRASPALFGLCLGWPCSTLWPLMVRQISITFIGVVNICNNISNHLESFWTLDINFPLFRADHIKLKLMNNNGSVYVTNYKTGLVLGYTFQY